MTTNSPNKVKPKKLPKDSPSPKPPKPKKVTSDKVQMFQVADGIRMVVGKKELVLPGTLFELCECVNLVFKDQSGVTIGKGIKGPNAHHVVPPQDEQVAQPTKTEQKPAKKPTKK